VAVRCRQCRREYEETLFELGRTIWCTCGARVGVEPRIRHVDPAEHEKRFAADAMLGRLARWLRLMGFDCTYDPEISDQALVHRGVLEGRIILTRDRRLPEEWWVRDIHIVEAEDLDDQLAEVTRRFELASTIRPLTRCSECNGVLERATREDVSGRVPERIEKTRANFMQCPGCGRTYWEGSHTARIRNVVERLAEAPESD